MTILPYKPYKDGPCPFNGGTLRLSSKCRRNKIQMLSASKVQLLSTFLLLQFPEGVNNTFENPTKPVWLLPSLPLHPKDVRPGDIFNQGVVYDIPLKR